MKTFLMFLIIPLLISFKINNCSGEETAVLDHKDSTKQGFWDKAINLQKRLEPVTKEIDFLGELFPKLSEPSIIHFSMPQISQPVVEENILQPLGNKNNLIDDKISYKPQIKDTLINGLFQNITLDKKIYKQGEIATLNVTTVLPLIKPEI